MKPGGQLAFQVPAMHDHPSHIVAEELDGRRAVSRRLWRLAAAAAGPGPDEYARLLFRLGFREPRVQLVIYPHVLTGREDVIEWMQGTLLTEYEKHLDRRSLSRRFWRPIETRVLAQLPPEQPFFFPFKRIICWARRDAVSADMRTWWWYGMAKC